MKSYLEELEDRADENMSNTLKRMIANKQNEKMIKEIVELGWDKLDVPQETKTRKVFQKGNYWLTYRILENIPFIAFVPIDAVKTYDAETQRKGGFFCNNIEFFKMMEAALEFETKLVEDQNPFKKSSINFW